jgi:hypothetical protein
LKRKKKKKIPLIATSSDFSECLFVALFEDVKNGRSFTKLSCFSTMYLTHYSLFELNLMDCRMFISRTYLGHCQSEHPEGRNGCRPLQNSL